MTDDPMELEERIHALLCGDLAPDDIGAVLERIARDEDARRTLDEMLSVQRRSRAAFGYDRAEEAMREPMARLTASLARGEVPRGAGRRGDASSAPRRWPVWPVRAAAAVVIAASVFVAGLSYRNSRLLEDRLGGMHAPVAVAPVTQADRQTYRQLWAEVSAGGPQGRPWVSLSDGTGEFGYLPPAEADAAGAGLILVRCLLASLDGREVRTVNLLLPGRRDEALSLPAVARIGNEPVGCEVTTSRGRAAVGLTVGGDGAGVAGIRGTVAIDGSPVEIGQLRLDGRRLRVVLHVVRLAGSVG